MHGDGDGDDDGDGDNDERTQRPEHNLLLLAPMIRFIWRERNWIGFLPPPSGSGITGCTRSSMAMMLSNKERRFGDNQLGSVLAHLGK